MYWTLLYRTTISKYIYTHLYPVHIENSMMLVLPSASLLHCPFILSQTISFPLSFPASLSLPFLSVSISFLETMSQKRYSITHSHWIPEIERGKKRQKEQKSENHYTIKEVIRLLVSFTFLSIIIPIILKQILNLISTNFKTGTNPFFIIFTILI